jgi:hypothetical protein
MTKFKLRTKPIVIVDATQITDDTFDAPHPNPDHVIGVVYDPLQRCAYIENLDSQTRADHGDWIIRGVMGGLFVCKQDVFEATYAPA